MSRSLKFIAVSTLSLILFNEGRGDGWRSLGPFSGTNARVRKFLIEPASHRIYATSDSGLAKRVGDSLWMMILANHCIEWAPGEYECFDYQTLFLHPLLNLWYVGWDHSYFEPGPILSRATYPESLWTQLWATGFLPTHFNVTFHPTQANKLYADLYGFAVSADTGTTWSFPSGKYTLGFSQFIVLDESNPEILFVGHGSSIYSTSNEGTNWDTISSPGYGQTDMLAKGDSLVVNVVDGFPSPSASSGIYFSSNRGNSWSQPVTSQFIFSVVRHRTNPNILYAGGVGEILASSNGGSTWTTYNNTLPPFRINQLMVDPTSDTLYAGTYGAGIIQVYESVVGVKQGSENFPSQIALFRNYPNPFNPSTTVTFELPHSSHVLVEVFNILGQKITTLLDEMKQQGRHSVVVNADGWSSGVYFVRLNADGKVLSRPILLLR